MPFSSRSKHHDQNELWMDPTIDLNTSTRDFVSPQTSQKVHKYGLETSRIFTLRQTSSHSQVLAPTSNPAAASYNVKVNDTGGFLNRKPHMLVAKSETGLKSDFAEVRFEMYGQGTTVLYKESNISQTLSLHSALDQKVECMIDGSTHTWQPLGPSKNVLELSDDHGRRMAIFVYVEPISEAVQTKSLAGLNRTKHKSGEAIGDLHIWDDITVGSVALDEVIGSALAVVERAKRRAGRVGKDRSTLFPPVNAVSGGL